MATTTHHLATRRCNTAYNYCFTIVISMIINIMQSLINEQKTLMDKIDEIEKRQTIIDNKILHDIDVTVIHI